MIFVNTLRGVTDLIRQMTLTIDTFSYPFHKARRSAFISAMGRVRAGAPVLDAVVDDVFEAVFLD